MGQSKESTMKSFAFVCLFAAAYAAAVKSVVETPAEVKTTVHAAPVVYSGVHHAAVAAAVVYNTAAHVAAPVVHTAGYYANSGGAVHIVKREAAAKADADADAAYYYSGYHHPYAYSVFRRFYGGFPYTAYNRGYFGGYYY